MLTCMSRMVTCRVPDDLLADIDAMVAAGAHPSRTAAIRRALEEFVQRQRRQQIGDAIRAGYTAAPPGPDDWGTMPDADRRAAEMVREEPW
jgi:Arc/MetJ-type ribon-helix-helix transcriptional regulator